MSPETRPPGAGSSNRAAARSGSGNADSQPSNPIRLNSQALHRASAASRQATLGWPPREPVSDTAAERAGSASAAREALFIKRGLTVAGPGAASRAMKVRIKAGEEIAVMQAIEATLIDLIAGRRS